jgi:serine/threonine-protein kinase RsbW
MSLPVPPHAADPGPEETSPVPSPSDDALDPGAPELRLTLPAEMATPSLTRSRLARWLDAHRWPSGQHDDLVLAVSEAVTNCVEHGYGVDHATVGHSGLVEVHGVVVAEPDGHRYAVLTVADRGAWLPPSAERGNRRHGIPLMEACVESMTIDGTSAGTTVVFRSRAVPPAS